MEKRRNDFLLATKRQIFSYDYSTTVDSKSIDLTSLPSPSDYFSEDEYSRAVSDWQKQIRDSTKGIYLPLPLSLFSYIPEGVTPIFDKIKNSKLKYFNMNNNELQKKKHFSVVYEKLLESYIKSNSSRVTGDFNNSNLNFNFLENEVDNSSSNYDKSQNTLIQASQNEPISQNNDIKNSIKRVNFSNNLNDHLASQNRNCSPKSKSQLNQASSSQNTNKNTNTNLNNNNKTHCNLNLNASSNNNIHTNCNTNSNNANCNTNNSSNCNTNINIMTNNNNMDNNTQSKRNRHNTTTNPKYDDISSMKDDLIYEKNKWGSSLTPPEPCVFFFDNFEDYKNSMKRWAKIGNTDVSEAIHPNEFTSSIGMIHFDGGHDNFSTKFKKMRNIKPNHEKIEFQRKFDGRDFLKMKKMDKKKPAIEIMLKCLHDYTFSRSVNALGSSVITFFEKASQYSKNTQLSTNSQKADHQFQNLTNSSHTPYKLPIQIPDLISRFENVYTISPETLRISNYMRFYKYSIDPFISLTTIKNLSINQFSPASDLSAEQTFEALNQLSPQQYIVFMTALPFYLKQLHIIKSNRIWSRFYTILIHMIQNNPKMISTFFTNSMTLSNVANLITNYAILDISIYSYIPSKTSQVTKDLTMFLFANQLTRVLTAFSEKYHLSETNKLIGQQIQAQTMTFNNFIDFTINNQENRRQIEIEFQNPKPIHCIIFHLLCDYSVDLLISLFRNQSFFIFLGKVANSSLCHSFYGSLCNHILRIPKIWNFVLEMFLNIPFQQYKKPIIGNILPIIGFLSTLVDLAELQIGSTEQKNTNEQKVINDQKTQNDFKITCELKITPDNLITSLMNIIQMFQYKPLNVLGLIRSVSCFCLKKKTFNPEFQIALDNFRISLLSLFKAPNLQIPHIVQLYQIMHMLFIPCDLESQKILKKYITGIVMKNMHSPRMDLVVVSWTAFREMMLDPNFQFLKDSSSIKSKLTSLVSTIELPPQVIIQILLLEVGFTTRDYTRETRRKRSRKSNANRFDQTDRYIIVGLNPQIMFNQILAKFNAGQLQEFRNEIQILKILMPAFKWKRRTISSI
ncbi:hypothetical protein TRFO_28493 [Tritrichomonas foetus]|uniref:Uncharacterized protein n=1 Tax=Tritrichomonas foetus TaxID=1144522 RepID=A0A1J4JZE4_9EUKA|nr:hypothetical protein TRFO_28493 [Tritrichomonas foetus]|eukprot:OHT04058.1 hypothetical protein TRFO_28493 [Tritrichomonas foetus]